MYSFKVRMWNTKIQKQFREEPRIGGRHFPIRGFSSNCYPEGSAKYRQVSIYYRLLSRTRQGMINPNVNKFIQFKLNLLESESNRIECIRFICFVLYWVIPSSNFWTEFLFGRYGVYANSNWFFRHKNRDTKKIHESSIVYVFYSFPFNQHVQFANITYLLFVIFKTLRKKIFCPTVIFEASLQRFVLGAKTATLTQIQGRYEFCNLYLINHSSVEIRVSLV